jgi:integrase
MAWKEQLPNGLYRACWRDDLGKRRSRGGFTQAAAAMRFAGEQESKGRRGETQAGQRRSPTWGAWSAEWLKLRTVEPSTARQDKVRLERYLVPQWAGVRLNRITQRDVQAWVNELAASDIAGGGRPLSAATVDRVLRLFSASMGEAVHAGLLPATPCVKVRLPVAAPSSERYLSRAEFDVVAQFLPEPYKTAAKLLAGTGMRFGEMAGLHWNRVDLMRGNITVVETWDSAARRVKAYPKSKKPRVVPIPTWVADALADRPPESGAGCGLPHAVGRCRSSLVVAAPGGGALDGHNMGQRAWADATERAGLHGVRLHDLRHSYASWLVQDGLPLQEVQRLLGHASVVTTQRYSHFGDTRNEQIRQILG